MKKLNILFFGKLKMIWNTSQLSLQSDCETIECLYAELLTHANEIPHKASIKVAINDEFMSWDSVIKDNDTIAFLPPASGG